MPGLVEVKVSLDETGGDEPPVEVDGLARGFEPRCHRRDLSRHDPDVAALLIVESRVPEDEVHGHHSLPSPWGLLTSFLIAVPPFGPYLHNLPRNPQMGQWK